MDKIIQIKSIIIELEKFKNETENETTKKYKEWEINRFKKLLIFFEAEQTYNEKNNN